jgi:hypothetical protein
MGWGLRSPAVELLKKLSALNFLLVDAGRYLAGFGWPGPGWGKRTVSGPGAIQEERRPRILPCGKPRGLPAWRGGLLGLGQ